MKNLKDCILESMHNPYLKYEIPTKGQFEVGDIVLYRDFVESDDEKTVMVVLEDRGNRSLVSEVSAGLTLGSTNVVMNKEVFKIGTTTVKKSGRSWDTDVEQVIATCESIGMDCSYIKNRY